MLALTWSTHYDGGYLIGWEGVGDPNTKISAPSQLVHALALNYTLRTAAMVSSTLRFHPVTLEAPLLRAVWAVARAARLRAYDAVYAALALERKAVLITLDRELCSKLDGAFPEAVLVTPV
jgi:predicted nucleic acid-binding protein